MEDSLVVTLSQRSIYSTRRTLPGCYYFWHLSPAERYPSLQSSIQLNQRILNRCSFPESRPPFHRRVLLDIRTTLAARSR